MKEYKVYWGNKANLEEMDDATPLFFECDENDIDTAYETLAETIHIDEANLIDFQNAKDDDVKTLLNDMKSMGFIEDWESKDIKE